MVKAPTRPAVSRGVATIRQSRDDALDALEEAINRVEHEIATTSEVGLFLTRLADRDDALTNEAAAIRRAATDAVLALPAVIQATATLTDLAGKMRDVAGTLPSVTDALTTTASILSLGQQFVDTIVNAQKKSS